MRIICIFALIRPISGLFKLKDASALDGDYFDYEYVCSVYSDHQSEQLGLLLEKSFRLPPTVRWTWGIRTGSSK